MIDYFEITEEDQKRNICFSILKELPEWFGIDSAIIDYSNNVTNQLVLGAFENGRHIGFVSIKRHYDKSAEIYAMGILKEYHRLGVGTKLLLLIKERLRELGIMYLTVKTLSESAEYEPYNRTRQFYINQGFEPLEELKTVWDEENPCLYLVTII